MWKSDGTVTGTVLVKDIVVNDPHDYGPDQLAAVGDLLFGCATDGMYGGEMGPGPSVAPRATNVHGSRTSTRVTDVSGFVRAGIPQGLVGANGTLSFGARGSRGFDLWKADGTSGGTVLVMDGRPGGLGSYAEGLTPVGGSVFFAADDGTHGAEL